MALADYLVATGIGDLLVDVAHSWYERTAAPRTIGRWYDYQGWRSPGRFVGVRRAPSGVVEVAVVATGSNAPDALRYLADHCQLDTLSIARMDVQTTVPCPDGPDSVIAELEPAPRLQCLRVTGVQNAGSTLYIGSPRSDRRLRIYNKSAESGHTCADGTHLLRIEAQLRNRYADRAAHAYWRDRDYGLGIVLAAACNDLIRSRDMLRRYLVMPTLSLPGDDLARTRRYERWMHETVIPALRRIRISDPGLYDTVMDALSDD